MLIKKLFPAFVAAAVFVSAILAVCILRFSDVSPGAPLPEETSETAEPSDEKAQTRHVFHEGELRGVWVPYFSISDGTRQLTKARFERRFDDIIAQAKDCGCNALFVHVRSHCDAAYPSEIFPFAETYLQNGKAPDYDPLSYMVTAAHGAGLELHAWINPYRISDDGELPRGGPCREWAESGSRNVIEYGGGLYLNPASSEVRSLIIDGVRELVRGYDVDGVHLDDYFYAFTESGVDSADYEAYLGSVSRGKKPLTLEKWRCANVSVLVAGLYSAVKEIDSETLFGISPQGNPENDVEMGADVYTWCSQSGYIDYIAPQIYYNSENEVCPFESTADAWRRIVSDGSVRLYIGLALYKAGSGEDGGTWLGSDGIIASQVEYARFKEADGYILYSSDYLTGEQTRSELEHLKSLIPPP